MVLKDEEGVAVQGTVLQELEGMEVHQLLGRVQERGQSLLRLSLASARENEAKPSAERAGRTCTPFRDQDSGS